MEAYGRYVEETECYVWLKINVRCDTDVMIKSKLQMTTFNTQLAIDSRKQVVAFWDRVGGGGGGGGVGHLQLVKRIFIV